MNEEMKQAWLEVSQMLGEPTREELDVFLRTWQRAVQSTRRTLAEQPAQQEPVAKHYVDGGHLVYPPPQRPWVGLTHEEAEEVWKRVEASDFRDCVQPFARAIEAKLKGKNIRARSNT